MLAEDHRIARALELIRLRYSEPCLRLRCVAQAVGLSPWHFDRLLKRHTGMAFREHLANVRLMQAAELLVHHAMAIKLVAYTVGYKQTSVLDRAFKRRHGCPPSVWRERRHRGDVAARIDDRPQELSTDRC